MEKGNEKASVDVELSVTAEMDQVEFAAAQDFLMIVSIKAPFFEDIHR